MERTWKPKAAGVLCIINGLISVIPCILVSFVFLYVGWTTGSGWLALAGAPSVIAGILPIVGGIHALRRKVWGLALGGAICALVNCAILGIFWVVVVYIAAIADNFDVRPSDLAAFVTIFIVGLAIFGILGLLALILVIRGRREFRY